MLYYVASYIHHSPPWHDTSILMIEPRSHLAFGITLPGACSELHPVPIPVRVCIDHLAENGVSNSFSYIVF